MPPIFSVSEIPCDCVVIETQDSLVPSNVIQCLNIYFQLNMFTTEFLILLPKSTLSADLLISVDDHSVLLGFEAQTRESFFHSSTFPSSTPHRIWFIGNPVGSFFNMHLEFDHFLPPQPLLAALFSHPSLGLLQSPAEWSPCLYPCLPMVYSWHRSHKGSVKAQLLLT